MPEKKGDQQKYGAVRGEDSDGSEEGLFLRAEGQRLAPEDEPHTCLGRLWVRFKRDFAFVYVGGYGRELHSLHDEQHRCASRE